MKVKILKKTIVQKNTLIFLILGLFFFHLIISLGTGNSAANLLSMKSFIQNRPTLAILFLLSFYGVWNGSVFGRFSFFIYQAYIVFNSLIVFATTFDKIILLLNFFYILSAYYIFQIWGLEVKEGYYLPFYDKNAIGRVGGRKIEVKIQNESSSYDGILTNWDRNGLFVKMHEDDTYLRGILGISIEFEGLSFECRAQVISIYGNGLGLRPIIIRNNEETLGWQHFYDIIKSRGYRPIHNP